MTDIRLRKTELIGVLPPVLELTLLRPYPPNAGRAMNVPPSTLATPSATSSLFAEICAFWMPCGCSSSGSSLPFFTLPGPPPRDLAATLLSKKPSKATSIEVPNASSIPLKLDGSNGKRASKGVPLDLMSPRMSRPRSCHANLQAKTAPRATTTKRSGM